jgi:magnesium-transporting ATPase (P-type)
MRCACATRPAPAAHVIRTCFPAYTDCFVVSGSREIEGVCSYIIVTVGPRSLNGRIMMAQRDDPEDTPLQLKHNALADAIAWAGMVAGGVLFLGLMVRFFFYFYSSAAEMRSQRARRASRLSIFLSSPSHLSSSLCPKVRVFAYRSVPRFR